MVLRLPYVSDKPLGHHLGKDSDEMGAYFVEMQPLTGSTSEWAGENNREHKVEQSTHVSRELLLLADLDGIDACFMVPYTWYVRTCLCMVMYAKLGKFHLRTIHGVVEGRVRVLGYQNNR